MEKLIVQKILLPARATFFNSRNYSSSDSSGDPLASSIDLLAPLAKVHDTEAEDGSKETKTFKGLWPTSLIFQIAIQSLTRITPKQRSVEDSWLQTLFYRILQHAFHIGVVDASLTLSTQQVLSINQMLRQVADHDIRINTSKLEPFLAHILSCPDGTLDAPVVCESIHLSILIDANIFIGLAAIPKDVQGNRLHVPNQHLATLLLWITNSAWNLSLEMELIYEDKLSKVVLPLVEAYAKARSLLKFISSWQEQLALCQKQRSDRSELVTRSCWAKSIWEDERLLQLIARLAESTLTAGQINNLLLDTHASLLSHETLGSDGFSNLMAKLVFLDCAFSITLNDVKSDQIKDVARTIFHFSLDSLLNKTCWPVEHKWRLWRVLIAFQERWNVTGTHSDVWHLKQKVIGRAVELTTKARLRDDVSQSGYAEELYAFAFVTSSISGQKEPSEHDRQASHDLIETVIKWISSHATREKGDEKQDHMASGVNSEPIVQWNGQSDGVNSLDILHLCYLAQFLVFPGVFRLEKPSHDVLGVLAKTA